MKNYVILFFLVVTGISNSFAQDTSLKKWSLPQCIDYARKNNLQVRQAELNTELSNVNYLQDKLALLPAINGSANYGLNYGKNIDPTSNLFTTQSINSASMSINGSITLFSGFKKISQIRQGYYDYMAAKYGTEQTRNDISLYVANAYLQIVFSKELLQRQELSLKISQAQRERTKQLVDAGTLAEGSLYQLDAQVATDDLSRVSAQNQYDIALLNLQQLLNLEKPIDVVIPEINAPSGYALNEPSADSIYGQAVKVYPDVVSNQFKVLSAYKGLDVAKSGRYPTLNFFAQLSSNYSDAVKRVTAIDTTGLVTPIGYLITDKTLVVAPQLKYSLANTPFFDQVKDNFGKGVGLSLSVPIFNGWAVNTNIKRNKIQVLNAELNYEISKNNLEKNINTAYTDAVAASKKYYADVIQVNSLQKSFEYIEQKFNVGLSTAFDYDQSKKDLNNATSQQLQDKYDYIFKLKVLDYYQGKPINLP